MIVVTRVLGIVVFVLMLAIVCSRGSLGANSVLNESPTAVDDTYSTDEDIPLDVAAAGVLTNDTDPEQEPLSAELVEGPVNETLTFHPDGSFDYVPNQHFNGNDSFTYRASDGTNQSNVATVTVTVNPINDAPTANDDAYTTYKNTPLAVSAPGVLANDLDVDGDPLIARLVQGTEHGTLNLRRNGSFTYTPHTDYTGSDQFTYRVRTGTVKSNIATVILTIRSNSLPIAADDAYSTTADEFLNVAAPGVLTNDIDSDGDPMAAVLVTPPDNGSVTLYSDGSFIYRSLPRFTGTDRFTYQATDGNAPGNVATVLITVNPATGSFFEEVTGSAGVTYIGQSYGLAWGDFNGDGYPDLWLGNHTGEPSLYVNNGNGTFTNRVDAIHVFDLTTDTHGAAWADFDRDGDEDLIELTGANHGTGSNQKLLYVSELDQNSERILMERAIELGLDYPLARGRTPLWLDYNHDGYLDLLLNADKRQDVPPVLFQNNVSLGSPVFENVNSQVGLDLSDGSGFAMLSDWTNDGRLDLICASQNLFPYKVYDMTSVPFADITSSFNLPEYRGVKDIALADFNGDLLPDLFLLRGYRASNVVQIDDYHLEASISDAIEEEKGFQFTTTGNITVQLYQGIDPNIVYIGSNGIHPSSLPTIQLSPDDPNVAGIMSYQPGVDEGIFIGYDPPSQTWTLVFSTADRTIAPDAEVQVAIVVQSEAPLSNLTRINIDDNPKALEMRFLINLGGRFANRTATAGLNEEVWGQSVVAGDFDNDGDQDLYIACSEAVLNATNRLYENRGDGTFVRVQGAGGAEGSFAGRAESVAVADYDQDGFLDLFVTNGSWPAPFYFDGPNQLFRNLGNGNHWLEIDLVGTTSNPHGIGARVFVTAEGRTQLREQGGEIHHRCQNDKRLHFGLGSATQIDSLVIEWPSGIRQELTGIAVDQILRVVEP